MTEKREEGDIGQLAITEDDCVSAGIFCRLRKEPIWIRSLLATYVLSF